MLYLSVFVILLAFFIVLYALSQNQPAQQKTVVESVTGAFGSTPDQPRQAFSLFLPGMRQAPEETAIAALQSPYHRQLAGAVVSAIPSARLQVVGADDTLEARLRADALFFPEKAQIRPGREELVDRLVALLANPPPGLTYEMEFRVGTDYDSTQSLLEEPVAAPGGGTGTGTGAGGGIGRRADVALALSRAGAFARLMIARGAVPQTVAVGVDPGVPGEVRLVFRLLAGGSP